MIRYSIKRYISLLLAIVMLLTACSSSAASAGNTTTEAVSVQADEGSGVTKESAEEAEVEPDENVENTEAETAAGGSDISGTITEDSSDDMLEQEAEAAEGLTADSDTESADAADVPDPGESTDSVDMSGFEQQLSFYELDDPKLLQYVEDGIYASLEAGLGSDDYIVEEVTTTFISKEYLEELAYNSQPNIFFGYTLAEIDKQFDGDRYIFTLGDNGETVVQVLDALEDTTVSDLLKNVAIGSGVIIACATVSAVAAAVGAPAVSVIFFISAKTGASMAVNAAVFGAISAGVVTGISTGDMDEALEAAVNTGGESFKWGAITGVVVGGVSAAVQLSRITKAIPTWEEAEREALLKYGGEKQVTYLDGEKVPYATPDATRPDIVRTIDGHLEAIEVKAYDLSTSQNRSNLLSELKRQVRNRVVNLPEDSTQRIVLNVKNRGYSADMLDDVVSYLYDGLNEIDPGIIIDIMS